MKKNKGIHHLLDLEGCSAKLLENKEVVRNLVLEIADKSGFSALGELFHQFKPVGVTGILLLPESHISVHTWPEHESLAIDIFSCGNKNKVEKASKLFLNKFKPKTFEKKVILR